MLTHFAILWNCEAASKFIPPFRSDVFLSFLPLAHAFERTLGYYLPMMGGATVAYLPFVDALLEAFSVAEESGSPSWDEIVETCRDLAQARGAMLVDPAG
jgi:acyl-CoA synthetase (AMP-forming)/AMP-acid ligase II